MRMMRSSWVVVTVFDARHILAANSRTGTMMQYASYSGNSIQLSRFFFLDDSIVDAASVVLEYL